MDNRLLSVIFLICFLMSLLLIAIASADEPTNAGGLSHPEFAGMVMGGDGEVRLEAIGRYAFLFQGLLLLLIVCLCCLGVSQRYRSPVFYSSMAASYGLMIVIWWQMYSGHQAFFESDETEYFMGFPAATAWQMYGTWFCAIPLILIYTLGFRKFIYTDADEEAFQALLDQRKS